MKYKVRYSGKLPDSFPGSFKVPQWHIFFMLYYISVKQIFTLWGYVSEIRNKIVWDWLPYALVILRRTIPDTDTIINQVQVLSPHI